MVNEPSRIVVRTLGRRLSTSSPTAVDEPSATVRDPETVEPESEGTEGEPVADDRPRSTDPGSKSIDRPGAPITVEGLSKAYGPETVIEGLDLRIEPGEVLCLLGPSGCGKTTLLHLLAGLEPPSSGHVAVDGEIVDGPDYRRGIVFQDPHLCPWLTVRENIELGPRLRGERPDRAEIVELVELIGLEGYEAHRPKHLSGGMAQRVSLARTLANDPELLLLDEPFSALDALTKLSLQDELRRIVSTLGLTAVFVTHDIDEAVYLGNRVAVMARDAGGITAIRDVSDAGRSRDDDAFFEHRRSLLQLLTEGDIHA